MSAKLMHSVQGVLAAAILAGGAIATPSAWAIPFYKTPFVPDFYQHQKSGDGANVPGENLGPGFNDPPPTGPAAQPATVPDYATTPNWWEKGGGWCCVAAFVNSFYFLEKAYGIMGLFTRPGGETKSWQEQMIFAIEDMAKDIGFTDVPSPLAVPTEAGHLRKIEAAAKFTNPAVAKHLTYSEFEVIGGGVGGGRGTLNEQDADPSGNLLPGIDVSGTYSNSLFEVYRRELCRSEDVTVRIQYRNPHTGMPTSPVGTAPWWSGSYHVMTGAGVEDCTDPANRVVYVADPDKRNALKNSADPAQGYDPNDVNVRERYPYAPPPPAPNPVPLPSGPLHYERIALDGDGCITSGLYQNACITRVTAISPVPTPSGALLFALSLLIAGIAGRRRARRA
jgi:hypothetical protein